MLNKIEEMKLVTLCMATDNRDAFSRLVVAYQDGLRRFILNLTSGDYCLTDDIAQETFLKAWLGIRSFQGLSGFRTWLYRIAVNEFLSYRRKMSKTVWSENPLEELAPVTGADPHHATDAKLDVTTMLQHLPDAERVVTLLFYLEDLPIKKICKITSMPEGTVKSYLNRARKHMSNFINHN